MSAKTGQLPLFLSSNKLINNIFDCNGNLLSIKYSQKACSTAEIKSYFTS